MDLNQQAFARSPAIESYCFVPTPDPLRFEAVSTEHTALHDSIHLLESGAGYSGALIPVSGTNRV
jgi:hypothetical protein